MSPNCMPCHKAYFLDDEGNYTEIGKITDADLTPQNDDKYDISCLEWDEMTITFKLSWWQRVKFKFLLWKAMRKEKRKRK